MLVKEIKASIKLPPYTKTRTCVPLANQSVISSTVSDQKLGYTRQGAPTAITT